MRVQREMVNAIAGARACDNKPTCLTACTVSNVPQTVAFPPIARFRGVLRVDEVPRAPVALHKTPGAGDEHGVP